MSTADDGLARVLEYYAPPDGSISLAFDTRKTPPFPERGSGAPRIGTSCRPTGGARGVAYAIFPSRRNPRWIFPQRRRHILAAGNIVKPSKRGSRLAWFLFRAYAMTGLPLSYLVPTFELTGADHDPVRRSNLLSLLERTLGRSGLDYILYTGTPGAYQKCTAQVMDELGGIICYAKISVSPLGEERLRVEEDNLQYLARHAFKHLHYPKIIASSWYLGNKVLFLSTPAPRFMKPSLELDHKHYTAIAELFSATVRAGHTLRDILESFGAQALDDSGDVLSIRAEQAIRTAVEWLSGHDLGVVVPTGFSHGDFSPWNLMNSTTDIFLYDWEMGDFRTPYWDIFNFVSHRELLITNIKPPSLAARMMALHNEIDTYTGIVRSSLTLPHTCYLVLYLTDIVIYYRHLLSEELKVQTNQIPGSVPFLLASYIETLESVIGAERQGR